MGDIKTIGVLTSGGDAPGMNPAIRAVVRAAIFNGFNVKGIRHGYNGLINDDIFDMNLRSVSEIIHRGGTMLYTARSLEFQTLEGQLKAVENCKKHGIDALVVIGGDGTFRGAQAISRHGIRTIGIPGTIDNDIACSDYTIGFDTALNTAMEMIDKLRDTTQSHERCSVVEVMGRHAGYIAVNTGIATGALCVLVPEQPWDIDKDVIARIKETQAEGKKNFLIIVAEGAGKALKIAEQIQEKTGLDTRGTVLGHVQRGGSPSMRDRVVAAQMGVHAIELLQAGIYNRVVAMKNDAIVDYEIEEALNMKKELDPLMLGVAKVVSI
ncbi:MAG: 6-phosphofructokinase [Oscillospiraceae bacterium]|nr:6-phosphofructokinase [Oscillospiraceae bacterium]MBQ6850993.1 6-phosphofructokinase [Oscillospiraceae bacterium]MBR6610181.1 6-phosphofructokinase [Oscillospiraceae bacterium]